MDLSNLEQFDFHVPTVYKSSIEFNAKDFMQWYLEAVEYHEDVPIYLMYEKLNSNRWRDKAKFIYKNREIVKDYIVEKEYKKLIIFASVHMSVDVHNNDETAFRIY